MEQQRRPQGNDRSRNQRSSRVEYFLSQQINKAEDPEIIEQVQRLCSQNVIAKKTACHRKRQRIEPAEKWRRRGNPGRDTAVAQRFSQINRDPTIGKTVDRKGNANTMG